MADVEKIVADIDWKVRRLVSDRSDLAKKLSDKENEVIRLQQQISELVEQNRKLREEKRLTNLKNIIINNSDISESKVLINDLLKKINRSISIISKDSDGRILDDKH